MSAELALAAWLDRSREASPDDRALARTLIASNRRAGAPADVQPAVECDEGGSYFPSPLMARWTLLSSEFRGDTVVARVSVTTVAEQDNSFTRWIPEGSSYARARALADSVRKAQP